ncbi:MAG: flavodoxin [Chloroflexi bacterium]|nr:flavodoxin [Anaerolineaceae bacterium]NMB87294.1 flavodoxin [Chloroflexota bacterium]
MQKIGLFYGSSTGNTASVARLIRQALLGHGVAQDNVSMFDVATTGAQGLAGYDALVLGVSTWDIGEIQYDWADAVEDLDGVDLSGKKVALFGLGDQFSYGDTFQDAMGILGAALEERGAQLVGFTSTAGYDFEASRGVRDGQFIGLSLDEDNQPELTTGRVQAWVEQITTALEL